MILWNKGRKVNERIVSTSSFTANNIEDISLDSYLMSISQVSGLRFQPIVFLNNGQVIAHEVLSAISGDPALFFSSLCEELHLAIFLWQLEEVRHLPESCWFNLPVAVFSEPYLISELIAAGPAMENISIELQDPENIQHLNPLQFNRLRSGVRRLQQHGWNIILDDLTSTCAPYLNENDFKFAAVKFDRTELRGNPDLEQQIHHARSLSSVIVLEGIETAEDLKIANTCKADAGQGFLWPERKVNCYVPEVVARRALLWGQRLEHIRKQRVAVNAHL
ncbi:EAL domain-containing protein [Buttiauxella selenatireducens]|uniref:EAL domain-containing protein n=1 Tax=Buttiauxella selenatireducens TaxID=3073902 RepID=A0ABY9SCW3_9ENTR|nr:EAL domain-containing protein [Buttiauxella sp. R73]WMY75333.1 EAL domain-containing protein [Buttiauxella sp. R73]